MDDFLIAYDPKSDAGVAAFEELEALYEWGLWETGEFVQCGVRTRQKYDQKTGRWGTIKVDMQNYGETTQSIYIPSRVVRILPYLARRRRSPSYEPSADS